ncbi:MAG TPA: universal stress protein [Terriglobales bacterium]|nr:universal stress protein [Terriglobales bacterium]
MGLLKRIIVGHDLRCTGEIALQSAVELARPCGAAVKIIHVIEPHPFHKLVHPFDLSREPEQFAQQAGDALESRVAKLTDSGIEAHCEISAGKPFVELIVARRAWHADLLVVGGPSKSPNYSLGRTRQRVIRKSQVPVLIAPKPLKHLTKRILAPTDFSAGALTAAREALTLAEQLGARVSFLHVLDPYSLLTYADSDDLAGTAPLLSPQDVEPDWSNFLSKLNLAKVVWERLTIEGLTAQTIVEQAESSKIDLIVLGTHGRSAFEYMLVGSVTEKVTEISPCPVLTVRPDARPFCLS